MHSSWSEIFTTVVAVATAGSLVAGILFCIGGVLYGLVSEGYGGVSAFVTGAVAVVGSGLLIFKVHLDYAGAGNAWSPAPMMNGDVSAWWAVPALAVVVLGVRRVYRWIDG